MMVLCVKQYVDILIVGGVDLESISYSKQLSLFNVQSREYKYNRQAFDQKARSMTQKYAMAGASGSTSSDPCLQLNSNPNMVCKIQ